MEVSFRARPPLLPHKGGGSTIWLGLSAYFSPKLACVSDSQAQFAALREVADAKAAAAIERLITSGTDRELARINVLSFAAAHGLDEEGAVGAFLHAAKLGLSNCRGTCSAPPAAACSISRRP